MCAVIIWLELYEETQDACWLEPIHKALRFAIEMQFKHPKDANLKGCILEKVLPPDGTDASPYYIRDLGTIFFVTAASMFLSRCQSGDSKLPANSPPRKTVPHELSPINTSS
jgi:hypothetical protein